MTDTAAKVVRHNALAPPEQVIEIGGVEVLIRGLTARQAIELEGTEENAAAKMAVMAAFDPKTQTPLFETLDDALDIGAGHLRDIFEAAGRLSGMGDADGLEKN